MITLATIILFLHKTSMRVKKKKKKTSTDVSLRWIQKIFLMKLTEAERKKSELATVEKAEQE